MKAKQLTAILVSLLVALSSISTAVAIRGHDMQYDANGNLVQGDGYFYEYNDANQLSRVRLDNASGIIVEEYYYDHTGRRDIKVEYTDEGNKTTIYWNQQYETVVYPNGSEVEYLYVYANGERVARKDSNGGIVYYTGDHLGSTTLLTDENGTLVERTKYYPYGSPREGGEAEKYLFTGKELDAGTGLYYYGARYYKSVFGRFTQPDTIILDPYNPQSLNRYAYTLNNPLRYVDPTGHAATLPVAYVGFVVGGFIGGGVSLGSQLWNSGGDLSKVDFVAAADATTVGAVSGTVAGFTLSLGAGMAAGSAVAEAGLSATAGVAGGQGARAAGNALNGNDLTQGLGNPGDMIVDATIGVLTWGVNKVLSGAKGGTSKTNNWDNAETLDDHFNRHGADFGAGSADEYAKGASDFYQRALKEGLPTKVDRNGVTRIYDPQSNTFGSYNPDGTTKTYFKPSGDGKKYWESQPGD